MAIILGIDPGLRSTGFGVIRIEGLQNHYVESGCIRTSGTDLVSRLVHIFHELDEVIARHSPAEVAVEQVFTARDPSAALKLGHARGVILVVAARRHLPVFEYSARTIKQAVTGYGAAQKQQVQYMVHTLLNVRAPLQQDRADALATALCHAGLRGASRRAAAAQGALQQAKAEPSP